MKKRVVGIIAVCTLLLGAIACGKQEEVQEATGDLEVEATENAAEYSSKLVRLGAYKGLTYKDFSGSENEPTAEQVEEEMESILSWFEDAKLTDAFVQENLDYESVEDFREDTKNNLRTVYYKEAWDAAAMHLYETVMADSEFELVQDDIAMQMREYLRIYEEEAMFQEMTLAEYLKEYYDMTEEEFEKTCSKTAKKAIQVSLVIDGIIEKEGISAEDSYERIAEQIAEEDGYESVEELETSIGGKSNLQNEIKYRLVAEFIMENGTAQ